MGGFLCAPGLRCSSTSSVLAGCSTLGFLRKGTVGALILRVRSWALDSTTVLRKSQRYFPASVVPLTRWSSKRPQKEPNSEHILTYRLCKLCRSVHVAATDCFNPNGDPQTCSPQPDEPPTSPERLTNKPQNQKPNPKI